MCLEQAVIEASALLHGNQYAEAFSLIEAAAQLAQDRDISGETQVQREAFDMETAATLREANRLH